MSNFNQNFPDPEKPNFKRVGEVIRHAYKRILKPVPSISFPSWPNLTLATKGLRNREYSILCGSTGSGKTSFCAALAVELVKQNIPTYVASVETGPIDFVTRMMSCVAKENWNLGDPVDPLKVAKFQAQHPWFEEMPLYLARYEDRVPNKQLLGDIAKAVRENGTRVAILDNLNFFIEVASDQNQIQKMDQVVHDAIIFCKHIDVHLIVVMHPKKTDGGRVISEFDIKGSSTAVQEAHNVFLFNRPPAETIEQNENFRNYRELKIAKCRRYGKHVGEFVVFKSDDGVSYEETTYERTASDFSRYASRKDASFSS